MIELFLTRFDHSKNSIAGFISLQNFRLCYTVENKKLAIPDGQYFLDIYNSPKFKTKVPTLVNVPERSYIHIHPANNYYELEGCIAPGLSIIENAVKDFVIVGGTSTPAFNAIKEGVINAKRQNNNVLLHVITKYAALA